MFSFFKQNKNNEVPEWASFFTTKEYQNFLDALDHYFGKKKMTFGLNDGILIIAENEFGFNNLGLSNLAQTCKQNDLKHYKEMVANHFDTMIRAQQFDKEFKKIVEDFEKVKEYIAVRLYPDAYVDHIGKNLTISNKFAGDITSLLVFDLPDSIINVQPEQASKWNRSNDELFKLGIRNIIEKYPLNISNVDFNEFKIWFVQSDHFFAPNIVFNLNEYPHLIGSKGSLIAIPHRHAVIIYPIENMEVVNAINALIPTTYGMNQEGPGSVSNNLFWYKDEVFENLPYNLEDDKMQFFPPANFVEVLQ